MRLNTALPLSEQRAAETRKARALQRFHQDSLRWSDGAYSWYLGQSGTLFECRGIEWDQFANGDDVVGVNDGTDRQWYTVMAMLGWDPKTGSEEQPTDAMLDALIGLVAMIRDLGAGDRVLPHNSFKVKRCPGKALTQAASTLDRKPINAKPIPGDDFMLPLSDEWKLAREAMAGSDKHPIIERIQRGLNALIDRSVIAGPALAVDSVPGPKTRAAWTRFEFAAFGEGSPADARPGRKSYPRFWDWVFTKGADCADCDAKLADIRQILDRT